MSQTPERRMYLHYKAMKRRYDYRRGEGASVLMRMAQRYRMPISEIKRILEEQKELAKPVSKPAVPKFLPEPSRFAVLPLDDPGYEYLWGIYDFYKCEWAGSVYGDRYQSADFELLSELCYVLNREEDNRYREA